MSDTRLPGILIVDDSKTTRAMIQRVIGMIDLPIGQVYEAADGAEGLKRLAESRIDLVLADLNMPVMDGFEMIDRMRGNENWRSIPVIVISAQPDPERIDLLKRNGVMGYLPKPFTAEAVRNIVGPLLEAAEKPVAVKEAPHESFNLTLAEALAAALETMAFISPELVSGPEIPSLAAGVRLVRVDFKGQDTQGSLSLAASPEFGAAMAANLDATHPSAGDDALKELANVTCGLLLRMRPGGGIGFHLAPPQLSLSTETSPAAIFQSTDLIALQADGHVIAARVATVPAFDGEMPI